MENLCNSTSTKNGKPCTRPKGHSSFHGNKWCPSHPDNLKMGNYGGCYQCSRKRNKQYLSEHKEEQRERKKKHRLENIDSIRARAAELRRKNIKNQLLHQAKMRAKSKSLPFDLVLEDIPDVPEYCPVLGIKIEMPEFVPGQSGPTPNSPSNDRIVLEKGYVKGNVRIISFRANSLRKDATIEELRAILKDMEELERNIK